VTAGVFHREAAAGQWFEMSLMEQLGNVGTEVARAARAKEVGNEARAWNAFVRAVELFDLTIADERWRGQKRREICRRPRNRLRLHRRRQRIPLDRGVSGSILLAVCGCGAQPPSNSGELV